MPPLTIVPHQYPQEQSCENCGRHCPELHQQARHPLTDARTYVCTLACHQALAGAPTQRAAA